MYQVKLFDTRKMDGAVALQAIFGLFARCEVICETLIETRVFLDKTLVNQHSVLLFNKKAY